MKKSVWIFLLAVFLPGAVLGWLALRGVEEQQIVFERRTAELYQKETEALASSVRDAIEAERRAFGDAVHRLLARSDAEALSRDFTNTLSDVWPRKAIGFALSPDGNLVSPTVKSASGNAELRNFLWDNGAWLCSTQPAVVYRVPIDNKLAAMGNQMERSKGYASANDNARNFSNRASDEYYGKAQQDAPATATPAPAETPGQAGEQSKRAVEKSLGEGAQFFRSVENSSAPQSTSRYAFSIKEDAVPDLEVKSKVAGSINAPIPTVQMPAQAASVLPALTPSAPLAVAPPPAPAPSADVNAAIGAAKSPAKAAEGKAVELSKMAEKLKGPSDPSRQIAVEPSSMERNHTRESLSGPVRERSQLQRGMLDAKPSAAASASVELAPEPKPAELALVRQAGAERQSLPAPAATPAPAVISETTPLSVSGKMQVFAATPAAPPPPAPAPAPINPLPQTPAASINEPVLDALKIQDPQPPAVRAEEMAVRARDYEDGVHGGGKNPEPSDRAGDVSASGGRNSLSSADETKQRGMRLPDLAQKAAPALSPVPPAKPAPMGRASREGEKAGAPSDALAFEAPDLAALAPARKLMTKESEVVLKKDLPGGGLTLGIDARRKSENERGRAAADKGVAQEQRIIQPETGTQAFNITNGNLYSYVPSEAQPQAMPPVPQQWAQKREDYAQSATTQNRGVEPMQVLNAPSQALSSLVPSAAEFRVITAMSDEGMVSRFVQDKLDLIFWIRPPEAPEMIFGCLVEAGNLQELWPNLLGRASDSSSSSTNNGHPSFILALLDDKAKPMATLPAINGTREWKRPFVASEIGEALPHWEAALYLATPGALAESARGLRRTLSFTVVSALALIILGAWLVGADLRRQLALAQQKTDFVSNVSHELKTPLTSIRMFAELMHDRPPPADKQGQYLRIITVEAERLTRLINNVLDFAKLERRQKRFDKRPLDLHQVIARVWEGNEMHLRDAGFTTRWQAAPAPYSVLGDEDALSQVLVNLLSNAEKYSRETKEVELHTWSEDGWLCICVLDRGMGVPAGEERKIFESFYRAHDSLSSGIQGSGLGLTLAQRLAEEHGGKIEFSRREGGGSRFTLRLPLVPDDRHHSTGLCGPSDAFPSDSRPPTV